MQTDAYKLKMPLCGDGTHGWVVLLLCAYRFCIMSLVLSAVWRLPLFHRCFCICQLRLCLSCLFRGEPLSERAAGCCWFNSERSGGFSPIFVSFFCPSCLFFCTVPALLCCPLLFLCPFIVIKLLSNLSLHYYFLKNLNRHVHLRQTLIWNRHFKTCIF